MATALDHEVARRIRARGPLPFAEVMELALYDSDHGFYATGGGAGRRGDFITSPEVGPLFGAVLGRALDTWWRELGEPDPFVVIEAAAGVGTLARSVIAGEPASLPALTYVLVERSAALRAHHHAHLPLVEASEALVAAGDGPRVISRATLPAGSVTAVIIANELLDNLPVTLVERTADGWDEVRVGLDAGEDQLIEHPVPASEEVASRAELWGADVPVGTRLPLADQAVAWWQDALGRLERGRLLAFDYGDTSRALAGRPMDEWLRTYRAHERGGPYLADLGTQDITCEVPIDQVPAGEGARPPQRQADFLRALGIDELVEEGRSIWHARAHLGDLEAIKGRSRVREAEALLDPDGLGAFWVLNHTVG